MNVMVHMVSQRRPFVRRLAHFEGEAFEYPGPKGAFFLRCRVCKETIRFYPTDALAGFCRHTLGPRETWQVDEL